MKKTFKTIKQFLEKRKAHKELNRLFSDYRKQGDNLVSYAGKVIECLYEDRPNLTRKQYKLLERVIAYGFLNPTSTKPLHQIKELGVAIIVKYKIRIWEEDPLKVYQIIKKEVLATLPEEDSPLLKDEEPTDSSAFGDTSNENFIARLNELFSLNSQKHPTNSQQS